MIPVRVPEIIDWKYEGQAKYHYQGDGVQLGEHQNGDDACFGLNWLDENIDEPSQADVDGWRDDAVEAYKWDDVRVERDSLLAKSDYVMMADFPLEDKSDWEAYRQELRDIPQDFDDAEDVEWPEQPSG